MMLAVEDGALLGQLLLLFVSFNALILFVAQISPPGTDVASLGLQVLKLFFKLTDSRRVCWVNTGVEHALQLLWILTHIIVHHLLFQLFNLPPQGVNLSHQQLLLVLQYHKLGVIQLQLGFIELQFQLVHCVPLLVVLRRRARIFIAVNFARKTAHPFSDAVLLAVEAHFCGSHVLQGFFGQ